MALSPRTISIAGALVISVLLIVGAFVLTSPFMVSIADAGPAEELLAEYAKKDTDADGLPDWQESLYKTDPNNAHSVQAGVTDKEAVAQGLVQPAFTSETPEPTSVDVPGVNAAPGTLTDTFARQFFEQYLSGRTNGSAPTVDEMDAFIKDALLDLKAQDVAATTYTTSDVKKTTVGGVAGLRAYAALATQAFTTNRVGNSKGDLAYFSDAILRDDASALTNLSNISLAYKESAKDLMTIAVPAELVEAHLALANALMRMSHATAHMAALKTDPIRAYLGVAEYDSVSEGMLRAFITMHDLYAVQQVTFTSDEAGFLFGEILNTAVAPVL